MFKFGYQMGIKNPKKNPVFFGQTEFLKTKIMLMD